MKIAHVLSSMVQQAAGPAYSVPRLCAALQERGEAVSLLCVEPAVSTALFPEIEFFAQDHASVPVLGKLGFSSAMKAALLGRGFDVVHNHGIWRMPNVYAGSAALHSRSLLVTSPRGMLAPISKTYSARQKQIFWPLLQKSALKRMHGFHATGDNEFEDIRASGFRQPVALIPNGVDLPEWQPKPDRGADTQRRTILSLGRLHPQKGLIYLVQAWAKLGHRFPDWDVVIHGTDDSGHAAEIEAEIARTNAPNIRVAGPVYGAEKDRLMRSADLFVLPSIAENFAMTVVESLAVGTPVIATKGTPWAGLEANDCGLWIDVGTEPLIPALEAMIACDDGRRKQMGENGHAWMQDFAWTNIANKMTAFYKWLGGTGAKPDFVITD